ncbi:hypothetical protein AAMO2058_000891800 [Amorphochlora amoebiformis]
MGLTDVFPPGDVEKGKAMVERLEQRMIDSALQNQLKRVDWRKRKPCDNRQSEKLKSVKLWKQRTVLRTLHKILKARNGKLR